MELGKRVRQKEVGKGTKQEQKRIKCFFDIVGTTEHLIVGGESGENARKEFFENLQKMEGEFGAKADITFVTSLDNIEEVLQGFYRAFKKVGMEDRVSSCQGVSKFIKVASDDIMMGDTKLLKEKTIETDTYFSKAESIRNYEKNFGKNKKSVVYCVYAGDSQLDRDMAEGQVDGNYYKGIPGAFIDASNSRNTFVFRRGEKEYPSDDSQQYERHRGIVAMSHGFEEVARMQGIRNTVDAILEADARAK